MQHDTAGSEAFNIFNNDGKNLNLIQKELYFNY